MVHSNVVTIEQMQDHLHTLDWAREQFAKTEPLGEQSFTTGQVKLRVDETDVEGKKWHERDLTDPVAAWLEVEGGERYQLTRQALMEVASECRLPRGYQESIPSDLLQTNANWWLSTGLGERDLKMLTSGTVPAGNIVGAEEGQELPLARAVCRSTISPFSNLKLTETIISGLEKKYGKGAVLVDYKFHHDLEATAARFIVPGFQRVMSGTGYADDTWSTGLQLKNSLIGLKQTELDGYLFRWWCTNGAVDTLATSGGFSRRGQSEQDALAWAAEAVDEILGGLEHTLDEVQAMAEIPVTGDVTTVLTDLFTQHSLPVREQRRIIGNMADSEDMNMYGLMQAITQAANMDGLERRAVESIMRMGGHLVRSSSRGRCNENDPCRRLLPEDWETTHDHASVLAAAAAE